MRRVTRRSPLTTGSTAFLVVAVLLFLVSCGGGGPTGPSNNATAQQNASVDSSGAPGGTGVNLGGVPQGSCIAASDAQGSTLNGNSTTTSNASNNCPSPPAGHTAATCVAVSSTQSSTGSGDVTIVDTTSNDC